MQFLSLRSCAPKKKTKKKKPFFCFDFTFFCVGATIAGYDRATVCWQALGRVTWMHCARVGRLLTTSLFAFTLFFSSFLCSELRYKLILLGNIDVGKTSLILRFTVCFLHCQRMRLWVFSGSVFVFFLLTIFFFLFFFQDDVFDPERAQEIDMKARVLTIDDRTIRMTIVCEQI
jgi:hypothetical protein